MRIVRIVSVVSVVSVRAVVRPVLSQLKLESRVGAREIARCSGPHGILLKDWVTAFIFFLIPISALRLKIIF